MAYRSELETRLAKKAGVHYTFFIVTPSGVQLAEIAAMLAAGKVKPVVDRVFPLAEVKEALAFLEKGRTKGKVVLRIKG